MSKVFRWGILSTAAISEAVIKGIQKSNRCTVTAVASRNLSRADAWARRFNIPLALGSYKELLTCGEVDLIYNPLPNSMHMEWTIKALEAGFPVLCEKPLTVTAAQALRVKRVAEKCGLPVAEAFMYRFHPLWTEVFDAIHDGAIGDVSTITTQFNFFLDDRSAIAASGELAGGALLDVGCYCVHVSRWFAGCEPTRVSAFERRSSVDDVMIGMMDFPNGVLAHFETGIANCERHRVEIAGTSGEIVIRFAWHPEELETPYFEIRRWGQPDRRIEVPNADPYHYEVEDFVDAVQGRTSPRWTIDDAVANMAAIDALFESARTGRAVEVAKHQ